MTDIYKKNKIAMKDKKITISESDIIKMVKKAVNEMMDAGDKDFFYPDYIKPSNEFDPENDVEETEDEPNLSDILNDCGWGYVGVQDMPDGRVAYRCAKHSSNSMDWEEVKNAVSSAFGDKATFGSATNKQAPEQSFNVVFIRYDEYDEEESEILNEQIDVRYYKSVDGQLFFGLFSEEEAEKLCKIDPAFNEVVNGYFECYADAPYGEIEIYDDEGLYDLLKKIRIPEAKKRCMDLYDKLLLNNHGWDCDYDEYDSEYGGDGPDD